MLKGFSFYFIHSNSLQLIILLSAPFILNMGPWVQLKRFFLHPLQVQMCKLENLFPVSTLIYGNKLSTLVCIFAVIVVVIIIIPQHHYPYPPHHEIYEIFHNGPS